MPTPAILPDGAVIRHCPRKYISGNFYLLNKSQNLLRHAHHFLSDRDTILHRTRGSNENYGGNNYDKETNIRFGTAMLLSRLQIQRHARIDLHLRWSSDKNVIAHNRNDTLPTGQSTVALHQVQCSTAGGMPRR